MCLPWIRWSLAVLLLAACTRCNNLSPLSDPNSPINPAALRVRAEVFRRSHTDGEQQNNISVQLRDEDDKAVSNPRIQILVNGTALRFTRGSTNYYVELPSYELPADSLPVLGGTEYAFTLVLPNGQQHPIGTILTQPDPTAAQFNPPATHRRTEDLVLRWQDLETRNYFYNLWKKWGDEGAQTDLHISKVVESKDEWGNTVAEEGSPDEADYINREAIGSGDGSLTIPAAYFKKGDGYATAIEVAFLSTEQRKADGALRSGSVLVTRRDVIRRINLVP